MATYRRNYSNGSTSSGKTTYFFTFTNASDSQSNICPNIPNYSILNNVTCYFEWRTDKSLTKGDCRMYMNAAGSSYLTEEKYPVGDLSQAKNSYVGVKRDNSTAILNTTSDVNVQVLGYLRDYFSSGKSNVGYYTGGRNLGLWFSATIMRNFYWQNMYMEFDYTPPTFTISAKSNGGGTVSGGGTFNVTVANQTKTITATPSTGYKFVKWVDSNGNTYNTQSVNVTISENGISAHSTTVTYTAYFEKITYTITVSGTNGTVTGGGTYQHGSTATLTATPNSGYKFVKWSDGNTSNPRTITVSGNATYTAVFEKITFTATFKNHDGTVLQTVSVEHGGTPSYTGSTPTRPSTAEYSYSFSGWSPSIGAITSDTTYTAQFTATKQKYTINTSATNGVVSGGGTYEHGTSITLTASSADGYKFEKWSDGNTQNPRVITVTGDATYEAQFRRLVLKFKTVKIYYPSESNVASPTNPLVSGEKAQIVVQVALE